MSIVISVANYFVEHPSLLVALFLLYLLIFSLSLWFAPRKRGPNPFKYDSRNKPEPLVTDRHVRDKVLKEGFQTKLVPEKPDAIVIGSGIGGLATAAILSKAGKTVVVLEQHDQVGGCCHTFIEDGFEFDVGIHYIGNMNGDSLNKFLLDQISCGQIEWDHMDDDYDVVAIKDDKTVKYFPISGCGYESYKARLLEKFPDEKDAIDKYVDLLKKANKSVIYMVIFKVLPKWLVKFLIKSRIIYAVSSYFSLANKTVDEVVNNLTWSKELRTVLSYNFGDYGVEPSRSSFMLHALLANHYMNGASYPRGGASELPFQIAPIIERMGGKIFVRARVTEVLIEDGRAVGVRVEKAGSQTDIRAPLVISDAGVFNTFTKLLPKPIAEETEIYKLIEKKINVGHSFLSLFVGLKGSSEELGLKKHNTWLFNSNDISAATDVYLKKSFQDALDLEIPLLFISIPSAKDSTYESRYPGKSAITVVTLTKWEWFEEWKSERVKNRGVQYEANKQKFAQKMWNQIITLYPQLEDKVEYMNLGTGLSNNFYLNSLRGEGYGLDHSNVRFSDCEVLTHLRPETGIPGLLLTGQDVFSCGLIGAAFGALLSASAALNRNLYFDLKHLYNECRKNKKRVN